MYTAKGDIVSLKTFNVPNSPPVSQKKLHISCRCKCTDTSSSGSLMSEGVLRQAAHKQTNKQTNKHSQKSRLLTHLCVRSLSRAFAWFLCFPPSGTGGSCDIWRLFLAPGRSTSSDFNVSVTYSASISVLIMSLRQVTVATVDCCSSKYSQAQTRGLQFRNVGYVAVLPTSYNEVLIIIKINGSDSLKLVMNTFRHLSYKLQMMFEIYAFFTINSLKNPLIPLKRLVYFAFMGLVSTTHMLYSKFDMKVTNTHRNVTKRVKRYMIGIQLRDTLPNL
jgi:hypothetical protein